MAYMVCMDRNLTNQGDNMHEHMFCLDYVLLCMNQKDRVVYALFGCNVASACDYSYITLY